MEKIKRDFLYDILHYCMSESIQIMVVNEYLGVHLGKPNIFMNNEDGLEKMLCTTNRSEIVRALSFGHYSYTDPFVKFNAYGNIESFDNIWHDVDTHTMIDWLAEGNEIDLEDAYMIMAEDDVTDVLDRFVGCFADEFEFKYDMLSEWVEHDNINVKTICREDWSDLRDLFKQWKENHDWQEQKTLERCGL